MSVLIIDGKEHDVVPLAEPASEGADNTLAGRRFHKHARNCAWCKPVLTSDQPGPSKLCPDGKVLFSAAIAAYQEGRPA